MPDRLPLVTETDGHRRTAWGMTRQKWGEAAPGPRPRVGSPPRRGEDTRALPGPGPDRAPFRRAARGEGQDAPGYPRRPSPSPPAATGGPVAVRPRWGGSVLSPPPPWPRRPGALRTPRPAFQERTARRPGAHVLSLSAASWGAGSTGTKTAPISDRRRLDFNCPARKGRQALGNRSATIAFSSCNSFTEASILVRAYSLIGTPWTISQRVPLLRIGNEQMRPFSIP